MKEYSKLVDADRHKKYHYFEKFKMTLYEEKVGLLESIFFEYYHLECVWSLNRIASVRYNSRALNMLLILKIVLVL